MHERTGVVSGAVRVVLRLEGVAALALAVLLYARADYSWVRFAVLFLTPDVSFLAYIAGPRVGAVAYNILHSYIGPATLAIFLLSTGTTLAVPLIWIAHIGFDRALGYGLKHPTAFSATHLGVIGKRHATGSAKY